MPAKYTETDIDTDIDQNMKKQKDADSLPRLLSAAAAGGLKQTQPTFLRAHYL